MNKLTHDQIALLVVRAQKGDQNAFADLYTATVDRQLYFAIAFLKDKAAAEDVVQEVYIRMFNSIGKLENPKVFVAYLNRICYNACVDYKKKLTGHKYELNETALMLKPDEDKEASPQDALEIKETNTLLYSALEELPQDYRTAFMLRYYQNMKIREVAEEMQLSESTVKRYVNAAAKKLKSLLAPYELQHKEVL